MKSGYREKLFYGIQHLENFLLIFFLERLRLAQTTGALVELPRDDWPPGFPRYQRALQLSRAEPPLYPR
jgi:hypothetical protein